MLDEVNTTATPVGNPMRRVLRLRDFRLLWIGQATSLLGDHFHFIAVSWLVLQLTNDPLALGTVLALGGVPRALFTLIGGAITDRFSPRAVMLASDSIRLALTLLMAVLVLTDTMQVWMFYAFALSFGVVSGFFMPASMAILPSITPATELQGGNALMQGASRLVSALGPMLAGGAIAWVAHFAAGAENAEQLGVGLALLLDVATFAVSVMTLWLIQARPAPRPQEETGVQGVWASLRAGLRYAWQHPLLRTLLILIAAVNVLLTGPLLVGIPVLADARFPEGAAAFGLIMGAFAGGSLLGIILAGMVRSTRATGVLAVLLVAIFGVGMIAMSRITVAWVGAVIMALLGLVDGFLSVRLITYLQRRTPAALLGRIMSLMLFANIGLAPLSQALAGALSRYTLDGLFIGAGAVLLGVAGWLATQPFVHIIDQEMSETSVVVAIE
ncbi:MAG TPA: MFS transporter [Chloroflexi bacterium]|nr:MFS transporter [Chloroflexota bacterium]